MLTGSLSAGSPGSEPAVSTASRPTDSPGANTGSLRLLPAAGRRLLRGLDTEHRPLLLVGQQIEKTIRPLTHLADPLPQFYQQRFAAELLHLLVEQDPLEMPGAGNLT